MIERILTGGDLLRAMRQVQKNHGSAGVDHMPVTKLSELMVIDREALIERVRSGKYLPQPIHYKPMLDIYKKISPRL